MCYKTGMHIQLLLFLLFAFAAVTSACQSSVKVESPKTCILPPYPSNGYYEVAGDPGAKPGDEAEYVFLTVRCRNETAVLGVDVAICIQGEWSISLPQCNRTDCEWNGVKGKCVNETQCLTTLDKQGDPHPVCGKKGDVTIVCCTDCELVNSTSNIVLTPPTGVYWKDGTKARDSCLQYLDELPYECRDEGFNSSISKKYTEEKKCHTPTVSHLFSSSLEGVVGTPPPGSTSGAKYTHKALLGYGEDLETAEWQLGGSIISPRYILTAADMEHRYPNAPLKFVALGVKKLSDPPSAWQTHSVKRFIPHPDFNIPRQHNDIALIETKTPITFNKNVLPACLQVEAVPDDKAFMAWTDLNGESSSGLADTIQRINIDKFSEEECKAAYKKFLSQKNRIDFNTQMCYGTKSNDPEACKCLSGEPLLVDNQFSSCIYTIIGVTDFGLTSWTGGTCKPNVYTRMAYYKPWIESVVWA